MSSIAIPLQTQVPQSQGPLQSIGQLLQTRDLGSQIALRRAQTQEYQAQADQKQRDLSDQNIVQQSMQDPAANAKLHTGDFSPIEGKVQPKTLATIQQNYADAQKALLAHTKEQNADRKDALEELNSSVSGLKQLGDIRAINSALPQMVSQLAQSGVLKRAGIDPSKLPQSINDPKQIDNFLAVNGGLIAAHDKALAQQKTQADIAEASGKGAASISEANIKDRQLANMSSTGLLPEEQAKSQQAAAALAHEQNVSAETARHDRAAESTSRIEAATGQQRATAETSLAQSALGDREISALVKPHQTNLASAQGQLEKITEATQMLNSGNAEAQALAVPKVLTALVSGQGSGVRITQPELNAIAKARGLTGSVESFVQSVANGKKLSGDQVTQLKGILSDVGGRIQQKMQISNDAINQIQNAPDRQSRIAADQSARGHINSLESGPSQRVTQYSKSRNEYRHSEDGGKTWLPGQ